MSAPEPIGVLELRARAARHWPGVRAVAGMLPSGQLSVAPDCTITAHGRGANGRMVRLAYEELARSLEDEGLVVVRAGGGLRVLGWATWSHGRISDLEPWHPMRRVRDDILRTERKRRDAPIRAGMRQNAKTGRAF